MRGSVVAIAWALTVVAAACTRPARDLRMAIRGEWVWLGSAGGWSTWNNTVSGGKSVLAIGDDGHFTLHLQDGRQLSGEYVLESRPMIAGSRAEAAFLRTSPSLPILRYQEWVPRVAGDTLVLETLEVDGLDQVFIRRHGKSLGVELR